MAGTESEVDCCILGHTHEPVHVPLYAAAETEKHYLNSGTFRTTIARARTGDGFVQFQRMSYAIVYAPGEFEDGEGRAVYEMWAGLRRRN